tara:strand:+ start:677 stop:940 length:264 start_codon:yes stop_codon:yes gene_type:complete
VDKIYRGAKTSSVENKKNHINKSDLVYRGSESTIEQKSQDINQDNLVYRGVSKDTEYYNIAKIRTAQKKRKLFHSGLELYATRKYCY